MDLVLNGFTLIIALVIAIIAILFILLAVFYCLRKKNPNEYKRAPIVKSTSSTEIKQEQSNIINIEELNQFGGLDNTFEENIGFLGLSLSEIPFIDESRSTSIIDLSWNPYKKLTNK
ncbi:hypothetical protein BpHYR1_036379 [Brachionus plicatilis]|uniref:Uncharacterized protein n=1 Tax=Brachionus plicatilis TaxID=10195 RepID=A0A3M7SP65_BRAPC|nr:hypothetical protein BpHYR1_036379 [Brachionus plicatilis]